MHCARSGDSSTRFKAHIETVYLDPSDELLNSLHGSTQVVNIDYSGQIHYLGQNSNSGISIANQLVKQRFLGMSQFLSFLGAQKPEMRVSLPFFPRYSKSV